MDKEQLYLNNTLVDTLQYTYYPNGNVEKVFKDNILQHHYFYDNFNRLTYEYNYALQTACQYQYNDGGNIIAQKTQQIINGEVQPQTTTIVYDYNADANPVYGHNAAWKDQLTSYDGQKISYDSMGNPTNYRGKLLTWNGRQLVNINGLAMQYDYAGQRTYKGEKTYYNQGNTILGEKWLDGSTEKFIYYYYDESGVSGFNFNGQDYHYQKNIFGDIIAIYDIFGNKICYYKYDAWGNHRVFDGSTNLDITNNTGAPVLIGDVYANTHTHIGNINSFRYRSYYYDIEIGMYYLQTRYYDPQVGRFINADDVEYLKPYIINGSNLYAYCLNNPIFYSDPTGQFVLTAMLIGLIVGAVVGGGLVGAASYQIAKENGATGWELVGWTALGVVGGAIIGGASGAGIGALIGWAAPAIGSFLSVPAFSFAFGDVLVAASVGQAATGLAALSGLVFFATQRMGPGKHSNNQAQNKEIDYLQKKYGFDNNFRRMLHEEITGQGYTKKMIEELIRTLLGIK